MYRKFIKKYLAYIIIISSVVGIIFYILPNYIPKAYQVNIELELDIPTQTSDAYYSYDGFYTVQSEEYFSRIIENWFISADFVSSILNEVDGLDQKNMSLQSLRSFFVAEQISANNITVTFSVKDEDLVSSISDSFKNNISKKINSVNKDNYIIKISDPVVRLKEYNPIFFSLGGFVISLVFLTGFFSIKEYFRK